MSQNEILLRRYIQKLTKYEKTEEKTKKDWMFGAIDFAADAGLIDSDTFSALLKEFNLT